MKKCNNDPSCSANPGSHLAPLAGEDTCHGDAQGGGEGARVDIQGFCQIYIWVIRGSLEVE